MADHHHHRTHQVQVHGLKGQHQQGPSASKVLALLTMLPVGALVLVPASLVICLAVTSFLASGTFGLTGIWSLSWVGSYIQEATGGMPESLDQAKSRMQDMAGYVGQKTKEVGQEIQRKAHDGK
ncbi:OLEOSIN [Salix purpurea]|uniref:OLEOSIN n=1 Tax=Salix purpurea TaxID=77065 RepID=A0A9Q1A1C7_SALPP|nr:OLEOSIN [Salix purpurea]